MPEESNNIGHGSGKLNIINRSWPWVDAELYLPNPTLESKINGGGDAMGSVISRGQYY